MSDISLTPQNLLNTLPNYDILYEYLPTSIYHYPPKLPISGELLTPNLLDPSSIQLEMGE